MKRSRWTLAALLGMGCAWAADTRLRTGVALLAAALSSANVRAADGIDSAQTVPSTDSMAAVAPAAAAPERMRIDPQAAARRVLPAQHSVSGAVGWSLIATAVPIIAGAQMIDSRYAHSSEERYNNLAGGALLVLGGAIVGPSAGYFYGGCPTAGWTGSIGRAVVAAVGISSLGSANGEYAYPSVVGSAAIIAAWGLWDIVHVGPSVREENQRRARAAGFAPEVIPIALDQGRAPGLALRVKF